MIINYIDLGSDKYSEIGFDLKKYDHKSIEYSRNYECINDECKFSRFYFINHVKTLYTPVGYIVDSMGRYGVVMECNECFEKFWYHPCINKGSIDDFKSMVGDMISVSKLPSNERI